MNIWEQASELAEQTEIRKMVREFLEKEIKEALESEEDEKEEKESD